MWQLRNYSPKMSNTLRSECDQHRRLVILHGLIWTNFEGVSEEVPTINTDVTTRGHLSPFCFLGTEPPQLTARWQVPQLSHLTEVSPGAPCKEMMTPSRLVGQSCPSSAPGSNRDFSNSAGAVYFSLQRALPLFQNCNSDTVLSKPFLYVYPNSKRWNTSNVSFDRKCLLKPF